MSDVQATATTQTGAAAPVDTETHFENLWEAGAFEPEKRTDGAASDDQNAAAAPQIGAQDDDAAQTTQQTDPAAQAQQSTEETPEFGSLDDLLTSLKVDPTSVRSLLVTTKIDGVEKAVPLAEIIESFQLKGHVNNKSIELSNQRTQFEQEQQAVRTLFQQQLQQNQQLGNLAMQMLNHDYQKVDWNGLRANNPAEFAALHQEFQNRQGQIQNYLGQIQQQSALEAQQQQQTLQQQLAAENERLMGARPQWRDPAAFSKDREQMTQYARSVGFKDAELGQIHDHRYMLILDDAARYRALQAAAPQALKQVRQAPVMAAPGSRTNVNPQDARRAQAIERFNRNPKDEDAQAAVFSLFSD
jgi:hypothetical protein